MELRMISKARPAANMAKELANTFFPVEARPAAMPIISHSAMPQLINRWGNAARNSLVMVAPARSASSTRMSGSWAAYSTKALP